MRVLAEDVHEGDSAPRTNEERFIVSGNFDAYAALAMARHWPEGYSWYDLQPWQRIGPELFEAVSAQREDYRPSFLRETVAHLETLHWVKKGRLSFLQLLLASDDALDRIMYRRCKPSEHQALRVALRTGTYLDLRTEATAFLASCLVKATENWWYALHANGEE